MALRIVVAVKRTTRMIRSDLPYDFCTAHCYVSLYFSFVPIIRALAGKKSVMYCFIW